MTLSESKYAGEFIVSECDGQISRDTVTVTVATAAKLVPGQVLGKLTATGKYVKFDDSATDGSETAAAILYGELDNTDGTTADFQGAVINFGAEVRSADLVWGTASSVVGLPQLHALGIKAR
jgi:hypothetical protein